MLRHFTPILPLLAAAVLGAQSPDPAARTATPPARKTAVTLNPFAVVAGYFAGDAEVMLNSATTVGIGASYVGFGDYNDYGALEAKARYYPTERALSGFSVAGTAGIASYRDDNYTALAYEDGVPIYGTENHRRLTRATVGTELSYQWLLGPSRRFVTVLGLGVKRMIGPTDYSSPFDTNIIPTARVNIGIAF